MEISSLVGAQTVNAGVARRDAPDQRARSDAAAPELKYPSPTLKYDPQSRLVIFQVVNPDTGDVVRQYPSEKVVKLYRDGSDLAGGAGILGSPIVGTPPDAAKPVPRTSTNSASAASKATSSAPVTTSASDSSGTAPTPLRVVA
ncbi:MAG: flagellar protein FlaG [Proteobacteria bacterium]|nr:flagellar protein FlaG [Pseudomonadota bacterium]